MPEGLQVTSQKSSRGTVYSAHLGERSTVVLISNQELSQIDGAIELDSAIKTFSERAANLGARFIGDEFTARMADVFQRNLRPALSAYIRNATALKARTEKELKELSTPAPGDDAEAIMRASIREGVKSLDAAKLAKIARSGDTRILAAILEVPAFASGITEEMYKVIAEIYRLHSVAEKYGLYPNHRRRPTLENPIVTGWDQEAVDSAAREILKRREATLEAIDLAAETIRRTVSFAALVVGKTQEEVFHDAASEA